MILIGLMPVLMVLTKTAGAESRLKSVRLAPDPYRVELVLNEKAPYTVARIDPEEVLIGLKATRATRRSYRPSGAPLIEIITTEQLPNDVAGINVFTRQPVTGTRARWQENPTRLVIFFEFKKSLSTDAPPVKTSLKTLTQGDSAKTALSTAPDTPAVPADGTPSPPVETTIPRYFDAAAPQKGSGTIDDIVPKADHPPCTEDILYFNAIGLCRDGNWQSAINKFDAFVKISPQSLCVEDALYLIGYCTFKITESMEGLAGLAPIDAFQEAISRFPESKYLPYAYAGMGMTHFRLGNYVEAQGYFNLILSKHEKYPGLPQIVFQNGKLHARRGDNQKAIETFRRIITSYPDSDLVIEAQYALGNTLFDMNHFAESLEVLKKLLDSDPKRVYQSPRLLQNIGNSYYHAEDYEKARIFLSKAYNLFPASEENPTLLTRIGDSYADQDRDEKAKAVYRYVMNNHPGTNGFVLSAMRYAEYLDDKDEKKEIYNRIATEFPDNPVARLALLRLSDLRLKDHAYEKSIESLKLLFTRNPTALKNEAYQVMGNAFLAIFKNLMQKDNYPQVIARYEAEKPFIDNTGNPDLFFVIGNACFEGQLYDTATSLYRNAYDTFQGLTKPPTLLYRFGVAAHESGNNSLALTMLTNYTLSKEADRSPGQLADSYHRTGEILVKTEKYKAAIEQFQLARQQRIPPVTKARISMAEAGAREAIDDLKTARQLLINAINLYSSVPENQYAAITTAYTRLGGIYRKTKQYRQAVDAYTMALKFAETDDIGAELQLQLGDAYQAADQKEQAIAAYQQAMAGGDAFLSKIAAEEIRTIELKTRMTRLPIETGA